MSEGSGTSKDEAKTKIAQALGLPATIDPTNYDPLAAAASGDADSTKVLLETARLANVMNQVDAFAKYRKIPFTSPGQAGTAFIAELAGQLGAWKDGDPNPLSDDALVQQALVSSLQALQPGTTSSDTSEAVQFIRAADTMLVQSAASGVSSSALAVALAKNQKAIVSKVIGGYASLTENGEAIGTLVISQQDLEAQSSSFASINAFPPSAPTSALPSGQETGAPAISSPASPERMRTGMPSHIPLPPQTPTWMGTEPCPCRFRPRAFCRLATPMT